MKRLLIVFILLILLTLNSFATDYYVKNGGNDGASGLDDDNAWETVNQVNISTFNAGDNIYFNKADEWWETLTPPSSGVEGNLITFGAYGVGANPIINGADLVTGWTAFNGNQWEAAFTPDWGTLQEVFFDETLGTQVGGTGELDAEFEWYWNANVLYVFSVGDADGVYTSPGIEASSRRRCLAILDKNYVRFEYIDFKYANEHGIICRGHHNEFDNIDSTWNSANGFIAVQATTTACTLTFVDCSNNADSGVEFQQGAHTNLCEDCIANTNRISDGFVIGGNAADFPTLGGENNVFRRCVSKFNAENGFDLKNAPQTIEYCETEANGESAIVWHHYSDGVIVHHSKFLDELEIIRSIDGNEVSSGNDHIYYNIMKLHDTNGVIGINHKASGPAYYYNNVLIVPGMSDAIGAAVNMSSANTPNVTFKNNIIYVTGAKAIRVQQTAGTYDFDNNCYYRTDAGDTWHWGAGSYDAIGDWRTASGEDANAINSDPSFLGGGDYEGYDIGNGSPCKDAGTNVGLTVDYEGALVPSGAAQDMGAHEYQQGDIPVLRIRDILRIRNVLRIK